MIPYWYKDAIIYQLDVNTFCDGNGDGQGDFIGLYRRLDYLASLGVNCLWLMPFFPSPEGDDGYDVADYYTVQPNTGTLGDFVEFTHLAREHGMRVLIDLVVNHTSIEHPWFQESRMSEDSPKRHWYVWSKDKPKNMHEGMVFPGEQEATWTYDEQAKAWYYHRFYKFQPDLNMANRDVREEIHKIMGFWLQLGVSGFRVDGAPFIIEQPEVDEAIREFREYASWRKGDAVLLAEANVLPKEYTTFFRDIHMLFNFWGNQHLFLSLARQDARPLVDALQDLPPTPPHGQWASFLRNHDELDLGRLCEADRQEVFHEFAPEERMRAYDRGIRRRLAPMFKNNRARLELAHSLMLTLPGTPVLYYGDEIGMGENLDLDGRLSVRTPMQWCDAPHAGFTENPDATPLRPIVATGEYGFKQVNVSAQRQDAGSLLNWMKRVVSVRRECPEFGHGSWQVLKSNEPAVFMHRCEAESGAVVAVHNLSERPVTVKIPLNEGDTETLVELLGDHPYNRVDHGEEIQLGPYDYRWYRVSGAGWRHV